MPPSLLQRRRRPFDPLTLANIFGIDGDTLADQLRRDQPRWLQPGAESLAVRPAIVPPEPIAPAVMPAVPTEYAPPPLMRPDVEALPADFGEQLRRQMPQAAEVSGAPPMVAPQGKRRPARIFIGDGSPEEREQAYADKVRGFQPREESWKKGLLRTAFGFLGGGIPGAIGTFGNWAMDRRAPDRQWQEAELAKATTNLGGYRDARREGLQDRVLSEQVKRLENPVPPVPADLTVGGNVIRRQSDGSYKTVYTGPDKPSDLFTGSQEIEDEQGNVTLVDRAGRPIVNPATGQPFIRRRAKPIADTSGFTNTQLEQNIAAAEAEKQTLGPSPPTMIDDTNQWGEVIGKKVNPAYTHWANRYNQLDDQIRKWRAAMKAPRPAAVTGSRPAPTTHSFSIAAYLSRNPGATEADARAYAEANYPGYRIRP